MSYAAKFVTSQSISFHSRLHQNSWRILTDAGAARIHKSTWWQTMPQWERTHWGKFHWNIVCFSGARLTCVKGTSVCVLAWVKKHGGLIVSYQTIYVLLQICSQPFQVQWVILYEVLMWNLPTWRPDLWNDWIECFWFFLLIPENVTNTWSPIWRPVSGYFSVRVLSPMPILRIYVSFCQGS